MKIWFSPYKINARDGFLIKIQTRDIQAGYADCMPWKIFGDEDVKKQIRRLQEGKVNQLLVRSLYYATLDGQAREKRISLFDPDVEVRSHYTCVDIAELNEKFLTKLAARGFETIKIKVGRNPEKEVEFLSALSADVLSLFRWRLDFNGAGGKSFLSQCSDFFLSVVEFVEDPEPYAATRWKDLSRKFNVDIAFDQPPGKVSAEAYKDIRVIKPARSALAPRAKDILTNSMDHPVGQSFAFWEAQRFIGRRPQRRDFGLKTNHLAKSTPFTREIFDESPYFTFSEGYGIGFNQLLKRQKWIAL